LNAICKDSVAIKCITRQHKKVNFRRLYRVIR
jgi:hypothetical protein